MSMKRNRVTTVPKWCCIAVIGVVAFGGGCQDKKSNLAAVNGTVQLNGQPLAKGAVITEVVGGRGAQGVIQDGKFQLFTFNANDGALVGTHKVAVTANEVGPGSGPESSSGKSLVPQRYNSSATSELTIDVKAGVVNAPTLILTSP